MNLAPPVFQFWALPLRHLWGEVKEENLIEINRTLDLKIIPIKLFSSAPLTEAELSSAFLKIFFFSFCQKRMKFHCMIFEVKIDLMIVFIFLSVLSFSRYIFSHVIFSTLLSENWFKCSFWLCFLEYWAVWRKNEKRCSIFHYKIRISVNSMHLRSNLTSEICQTVRSLNWKTKQNLFKAPILPPFPWKTVEIQYMIEIM